MIEQVCDQCGHSLSSRVHLEGLNGIHEPKETGMPVVNGKHFSYGPKGQAAAKAESKRTGKPVKMPSKGGKKK